MNIGKILDWDVGRSFCAKVGRVNNFGVDSDFSSEFRSGDDR